MMVCDGIFWWISRIRVWLGDFTGLEDFTGFVRGGSSGCITLGTASVAYYRCVRYGQMIQTTRDIPGIEISSFYNFYFIVKHISLELRQQHSKNRLIMINYRFIFQCVVPLKPEPNFFFQDSESAHLSARCWQDGTLQSLGGSLFWHGRCDDPIGYEWIHGKAARSSSWLLQERIELDHTWEQENQLYTPNWYNIIWATVKTPVILNMYSTDIGLWKLMEIVKNTR